MQAEDGRARFPRRRAGGSVRVGTGPQRPPSPHQAKVRLGEPGPELNFAAGRKPIPNYRRRMSRQITLHVRRDQLPLDSQSPTMAPTAPPTMMIPACTTADSVMTASTIPAAAPASAGRLTAAP